ncbi:MAG TPA: glycoside hydrolase family 30 beta sandwich domain-containing protein [Elusimicrobiota bacterium]|jgi:glucosylceramidase|nr:glycoside hydrolase family 30 beta sandwich domain-containing protein [Elusimicrobiota bacterium]
MPALVFAALVLAAACAPAPRGSSPKAQFWLTEPDRSALFSRQPDLSAGGPAPETLITVDEKRRYQSMEGFGFALTGGSALLLARMSPAARSALLKELFSPEDGIGVSDLRVSVGSSDLDERVFSYDDLPPGETDPRLAHFSLAPDREHLVPILKEILALAPGVWIMATPWSPPAWMKDDDSPVAGSLRPEFRAAYADYLVKYVRAMAAEGVRIDALTIQNEPLNPKNNPSMIMTAAEQTVFLRDFLGPAFAAAKLPVKLLIYDHNADRIDYPLRVLADPGARRYAAGSAFHLYGGSIDDLSKVHAAYPDKDLYFTEQWVGAPANFAGELAWHVDNLVIGAPRNWCRTVLEWNLASDPVQGPHTDKGGCVGCLGAVTLDGDAVTRNPAYYIIAHASKFVRPGSTRIDSNEPEGLRDVAYLTPRRRFVLIARNVGTVPRDFGISQGGRTIRARLDAGAVGTFVWDSGEPERPVKAP